MDKKNLLPNLLLGIGISGIGVFWGDKVTALMSVGTAFQIGYNYLSQKNIDWWDSYLNAEEIIQEIDSKLKDDKQSAEYYQMMREIILKISCENREEKRKLFLELAIKFTKDKKIEFDEKIMFINILDSLTEGEIQCLFIEYDIIDEYKFYQNSSRNEIEAIEFLIPILANKGLLTEKYEIENIMGRKQDEIKKKYEMNLFGMKFLSSILDKNTLTENIKRELKYHEEYVNDDSK